MNNDELIVRFQELKESIETLAYDNKAEKDKIKKRLEMLIRNKFGDESHYLKDLLEVEFYYHLTCSHLPKNPNFDLKICDLRTLKADPDEQELKHEILFEYVIRYRD